MGGPEFIAEGIFLIGGPNISHSEDATAFALVFGTEIVLIDSGAGRSVRTIIGNMERAELDPCAVSTLILTHCHIDHIGGAPFMKKRYGCRLLIHAQDAKAVETGDPVRTAANWYGTDFPATPVDVVLQEDETVLSFGKENLHLLHTPGHTPGSLSIYLDRGEKRILFGQDIHGPFLPAFDSDIIQWRESMHRLLDLEADVLCEGHFGIFRAKDQVRRYIQSYLDQHASR